MTADMASTPSPIQDGPTLINPLWTSSQLMTLKVGSKIHIQAIVLSTVGTIQGNRSEARIAFLNLNC